MSCRCAPALCPAKPSETAGCARARVPMTRASHVGGIASAPTTNGVASSEHDRPREWSRSWSRSAAHTSPHLTALSGWAAALGQVASAVCTTRPARCAQTNARRPMLCMQLETAQWRSGSRAPRRRRRGALGRRTRSTQFHHWAQARSSEVRRRFEELQTALQTALAVRPPSQRDPTTSSSVTHTRRRKDAGRQSTARPRAIDPTASPRPRTASASRATGAVRRCDDGRAKPRVPAGAQRWQRLAGGLAGSQSSGGSGGGSGGGGCVVQDCGGPGNRSSRARRRGRAARCTRGGRGIRCGGGARVSGRAATAAALAAAPATTATPGRGLHASGEKRSP
jgi:hypothetical protein